MSLRKTATKGMIWSAAERLGDQGVMFVVQIILARLLAPEQFGLIAMLTIFLAISAAIIDAGFSQAIIQRQGLTDRDLSTVFFFNLAMSTIMAAVLWHVSPWVARFYEQPELTGILQWLSFGLVIGSLASVHRAYLQRQLKFDRIFQISVPSAVLGGATGIALAWAGFGVWALVAQSLVLVIVRTILFWAKTPWRPNFEFSGESLGKLLPYGWKLAVSSILDQGFANVYMLVIGKVFTAADLGFYHRAKSFQKLPMGNLQGVIASVAFPMLASMQSDPMRLKSALRKAIPFAAFLAFPLMALMAAVAEPLVITLIGPQWLPSVPYLQALCIVGGFAPIHSLNLNVLKATGRSDLFLGLEVLKKLLTITNIAITYRFGIMAMIWGGVFTSLFALMLNSIYTRRIAGYSLLQQIRDMLPMMLLSLILFLSVSNLIHLLPAPAPIQLAAGVAVGLSIVLIGLRFMGTSLSSELTHLTTRLPGGLQPLAKMVLKSAQQTTN